MRRKSALLGLLFVACTGAPPRPEPPAPAPVTLTFDWSRVGRLGVGFETVHRRGEQGAPGRRYLGRFEWLTERSPEGLHLTSQGLSLEDAPPVATIPDAIARLSVTGVGDVEVGSTGELLEVTRTEEVVLDAIGPALPAFEALRQQDRKRFLMEVGIGMPLLVRRNTRALWGRLVGQWAGQSVVPGVEVSGVRSETDEVLGPAKRDTAYTFTITTGVSCGEGEPETCIQLESHAEAVKHSGVEVPGEVPVDMSGTHEARLVLVTDPRTLVPRRMIVRERITLTTAVDGPQEIFRETRYAFFASERRVEPERTPRQMAEMGAAALLAGDRPAATRLLEEAEVTARMLQDGLGQATALVVRASAAVEDRNQTEARLAVATLKKVAPRATETRLFEAWIDRWAAAGKTDALEALFAAWEAAARPGLLDPRLLPGPDNNRPRPVACPRLLDTDDTGRVLLARVESEPCPELAPLARTHPGPDAGVPAWIAALSAVATQVSDDEPERIRWIARTLLDDLARTQPDNGLWPVWQVVGNAGVDDALTEEDLARLEKALAKGLDLQQETLVRAYIEAYQAVGINRPEERALRAAMVVLPVEAVPALIRRARVTKGELAPRAAAVLDALATGLVEEPSALAHLLAPTLRREAAALRGDDAAVERYLNQEQATEALVSHGRRLHHTLTRWPIPGLQTALAARFRAGEMAWYAELTRRLAETPTP